MKHLTTILKPRQHELEARLDPAWQPETEAPVVGTGNLVYEARPRRPDDLPGALRALRTRAETRDPVRRPMHPVRLRCSSLTYSRYARSSTPGLPGASTA